MRMRILTRSEHLLAIFRALRRNSLANANGFANEIAKSLSSLRKFLANGSLRQNSLAIANAMAWCTQERFSESVFAFYLNDRFSTKILGFKGRGS